MNDAQWQALIIGQVGDVATPNSPSGILADMVPYLWDQWQSRRYFSARLQYLYTKRDAIDLVLSQVRFDVDATIPEQLTTKESQKTAYLNTMRDGVLTEITALEKKYRATRAPVLQPLVTVTPISVQDEINRQETLPYPIIPDPNSPGLAGTPFQALPLFGPFGPGVPSGDADAGDDD